VPEIVFCRLLASAVGDVFGLVSLTQHKNKRNSVCFAHPTFRPCDAGWLLGSGDFFPTPHYPRGMSALPLCPSPEKSERQLNFPFEMVVALF